MEITITIQGEPDTAPIIRIFPFHNNTDYVILENSVKTIENKISKKMRININETLDIYLNYIISQLRVHKKVMEIKSKLSKLLSPEQVMIGVPESLRKINFNTGNENKQKLNMTITEPISTTNYILSSSTQE
jgi:urease gamma subunit